MIRLVAVLLLILATPSDHLAELAHNGSIDEKAAIKAHAEITIAAPPEKVWALLTGIKDWPTWQKNISSTVVNGPVQSGTSFSWTTGGTHIRSQIASVKPFEQFVWTGVAYNAHAIHVWNLERLPDNRTLIRTSESMSGLMLSLFYSSKQLRESHQDWLTSLKRAAENSSN